MLASFHPVIAEIFSFKKLPDKWLAEPEEGVAPEWAAGLHFYVDFDAEATITTIREDINLIYLLSLTSCWLLQPRAAPTDGNHTSPS